VTAKGSSILVLFPNDWDRGELARECYRSRGELVFDGGDLFKLPGALRLLYFDPLASVARLARKYRGVGLAGVMSSDEYVGAAMAAALARELGLPHAEPEHILTAQHKLASRRLQKEAVPEAVPDFARVSLSTAKPDPPLAYPFFVKPVKGTFSLFAKKVDDEAGLRAHLAFKPWERFALGRVTAPFDRLVRAYTSIDTDARAFIAESLIEGVQVTLDGFAFAGEVHTMGIVDSVMFPGTSTFERFDYPSRMIPKPVQERMSDIAVRLVKGLGVRQAQFNIELFWDEERDRVSVIEINPRLSYQFADLYENVDGTNSYDVLLDLTLGKKPTFQKGRGRYAFASSFVLRTFQGKRLRAVPSPADVEAFAKQYDDARLRIYGRSGSSLEGEMRAMGSYRYGIVNVGAGSLLDLFAIYNDAIEKLPFRFE
jgi:biotin carboxylase